MKTNWLADFGDLMDLIQGTGRQFLLTDLGIICLPRLSRRGVANYLFIKIIKEQRVDSALLNIDIVNTFCK